MRKVIFIDRDGVINWDPIGDYITQWDDFKFFDGVLEALRMLSVAGFEIVIISNQAGIGDGRYRKEDLDEITENMLKVIKGYGAKVTGVYYCLHGKNEGCDCRKPQVGLFKQAARDIAFDPRKTYFIGDKVSDIEAGQRFQLRTVLVLTGHGAEQRTKLDDATRPDYVAHDLMEAVQYILESEKSKVKS
jgi:D-glycero-D-manno-heptose 1,7-bisphosphate phosphatase